MVLNDLVLGEEKANINFRLFVIKKNVLRPIALSIFDCNLLEAVFR